MTLIATCVLAALAAPGTAMQQNAFRPPAVPLVVHDPYFSVWSAADKLTDRWTTHWTGSTMALCGLVRVDGKCYRWSGLPAGDLPAAKQLSVRVDPTTTTYQFEAGGARFEVRFVSPILPHDLELLSRPATYVNVRPIGETSKSIELYMDVSSEWCVDKTNQKVSWSRLRAGALELLSMGVHNPEPLTRAGDDLRGDWGKLILALPRENGWQSAIAGHGASRSAFVSTGSAAAYNDTRMPRAADDDFPVMAASTTLKGNEATLLIAYDRKPAIEFLQRRLNPYWAKNGEGIGQVLDLAYSQRTDVFRQCAAFDADLRKDLESVGGPKYAEIGSLAYRQSIGAQQLCADVDGSPLLFSKECFSNGCIATVDVTYPGSPMYLLLSPELLKAQVKPIMDYASLARWKWPFAPHDLGTFPIANGQVYGGGERTEENQMPVEESGNMVLMACALAKAEGKPDFAVQYWKLLKTWTDYLVQYGLDPANQLCTDDFAGHLAHNANLSLKAILGIAAFADLCNASKQAADAKRYRAIAEDYAMKWIGMAKDGDHYKLAFDKPGTWSQKYNLAWDRVLGLNLFPKEVFETEVAYYKTKLAKYGLPLDNRSAYTKGDWCAWTATLASNKADMQAMLDPLYAFLNDSPSRVPFSDWHWTTDAKQVGFQARSVVGGVFMPMLADPKVWAKWRK